MMCVRRISNSEVHPSLDPLRVPQDEEERRGVAVDLGALRGELGVVDVGDLEARPPHVHPGVAPAAAATGVPEVPAMLVAHVRGLAKEVGWFDTCVCENLRVFKIS